jgi:DNA replication protein DnaC
MNAGAAPAAELTQLLRDLHLPTVRECFGDEAERARRESLAYERYLLELVRRESEVRRDHRIARLLRESRLPLEKNLATFERRRLPRGVGQQLEGLLEGSFLERRENVLAFGNPGSGKTHLLCALGQELIVRYGRRVLFTPCVLLVQELLIAKRDLRLGRALKRLRRYDAVVLDDLGYVQQDRDEMEVLFAFFADRYERGSVLLTSNLPFSKWEAIFKDPMTTAAAIDRLVHHSVILELNLPSYRLEASRLSRGEPGAVPAEGGKDGGEAMTPESKEAAIVAPGASTEVAFPCQEAETPIRSAASVRKAGSKHRSEREK